MKAVITVVGKDSVGILAKVSGKCADFGGNIIEVSQTILQEMFCMIMVCDVSNISVSFGEFSKSLSDMGTEIGMSIRVMHEDVFNSMHRI